MALGKKLGFLDVFCLASGAMISSGLFVLPGQAYAAAGPAVVLAYAIAALMMFPAMLSQAELATAMPKSGGSYFFIERSMGAFPGTLAGIASWLSLALKSAFAMIGIGAFARLLFPDADLTNDQWEWLIKGIAVTCCVIFAVMNCLSVKMAGRSQVVMVFGLLGALVLYVILGFDNVQQHPNFDNFLKVGWNGIFATAGLVFVSFGGLTKAANVAEEVVRPDKNLPRAMFLAFWVVSLLYVFSVLIVVGTVPGKELAHGDYVNLTPISVSAGYAIGRWGLIVLSAAAILAFVTTGNGGIMAASRCPLAMSRDGLLPRNIQRVSKRFETPYVAVIITSAFMIAVIVLLEIGDLVKVASTMLLILFILINTAVLVMRGSKIQNYMPKYKSPFFPWIQILGICLYAMLLVELAIAMGWAPRITAIAFVVVCLGWYWVYARPRNSRESALYFLVQRIISPKIKRAGLEQELRGIATERDEIVHDRFDKLIQNCEILDIPGHVSKSDLFEKAGEILAGRLDMSAIDITDRLRLREASSSTMIHPGLAIPHIIVDGEGLFDILPVRCKPGIIFDVDQPYVKTAFILIGSEDQRNYHLRALMTIATIIEEKDFMANWLNAENIENLRDLILLSGRKRDIG